MTIKLDLLTNATVVDDAIRFVSSNTKEKLNFRNERNDLIKAIFNVKYKLVEEIIDSHIAGFSKGLSLKRYLRLSKIKELANNEKRNSTN